MDFLKVINLLIPIQAVMEDPSLNNLVMLSFVAIIVSLTMWYGLKFSREYAFCRKEINNALSFLKGKKNDTISSDFEGIVKQLSENALIGPIWGEYEKTIVKVVAENGKVELFSTTDAICYFNEESLIGGRIRVDLYGSIPSLLTGLGIFGTFLGLTIGLSGVGSITDNAQASLKGIKDLLDGMGTAFATSLWGLVLALPFTLWFKRRMEALRKDVQELQSFLDLLFIKKPSEKWLSEILREQCQQTQELKSFNTELAMSIAEALDIKLSASITPVMDKLLQAITELTRTGASEMAKTISEGAGKELDGLGKMLQNLQESLQAQSELSRKSTEHANSMFESRMSVMADRIDGILTNALSTQRQANEVAQAQLHTSMSTMLNEFQKLKAQMEQAGSEGSRRFVEQIQTASISLAKIAEQYDARMSIQSEQMSNNAHEMNEALRQTVGRITEAENERRTENERLMVAVTKAVEQIGDTTLAAAMAAKEFADAAGPMSGVAERIYSCIIQMEKSQELMTVTTKEASQSMVQAANQTAQGLKELRAVLDEAGKTLSMHGKNLAGLRVELDELFQQINTDLTEYNQTTSNGIANWLSAFDKQMASSLSALASLMDDLKETLEDAKSGNR